MQDCRHIVAVVSVNTLLVSALRFLVLPVGQDRALLVLKEGAACLHPAQHWEHCKRLFVWHCVQIWTRRLSIIA